MTDLLSIGASGIKAYSRALATVSDNIANSQTPGYSRRTVRLEEAPTPGDLALFRSTARPGGVREVGVDRATDQMLVEDSRVANSDAGRSSSRLRFVEAGERALDDSDTGVGVAITGIFNKADLLSADPGSKVLRSGFLNAVDEAASAFRRTAVSLESAASGVASEAQGTVDKLNTSLTALERVNDGLRRSRDGSTNQATLLDERDRLIDEISGSIAVSSSYGERGIVSLRAGGPTGDFLVDSGSVSTVSLAVAGDGQLSFGLSPSASGTLIPVSGSLAGLAEAANQISTRRTQLDTLANQFAADLNAAHQSGRDSQGNPGTALLDPGSGAATLTALALDSGDVAAADAGSANGNILSFANLRGPNGPEAGFAALAAQQSQASASARALDAAATTRREGAFEARDDLSAVDLDHEAGELLRFQQAYEGAARTIQVARETLQTILNIF
ncbi:MAG: flagellar hook-associated protein FlgK [Pseudomonadota bacterium]